MTKERARQILEGWVNESDTHTFLPIVDVVVYSGLNEDWTWKGLIKIAYDLKDSD